jgi:hypothetical protein
LIRNGLATGIFSIARSKEISKLTSGFRIVPLENLERFERTGIILRCEFSPAMATFLFLLFVALRSILRSRVDLQLENLALRHQIGVLQRSVKMRPKLAPTDRIFWICLSRLWRGWRSALVLVKPETVVAWHRGGFRRYWTSKVRQGQPGRPGVTRDVRDLIRRMCRENPTWGAPRIHGELLKLGIDIGQTSVSKYMVRCRPPPLKPGAPSYRTTSHSSFPSISLPSRPSVFRSSTCFWSWPMIVVASSTST